MNHTVVDPQTPEEWREAVDAAYALLQLDALRQYGLVEGGPSIYADRCREIIERGRELGIRPTHEPIENAGP